MKNHRVVSLALSVAMGVALLPSAVYATTPTSEMKSATHYENSHRQSAVSVPANWKPWVPKGMKGAQVERKGVVFEVTVASSTPTSSAMISPHVALPADPSWTWSDAVYQSWMSQLENDIYSGDHYNLHVQPKGGGWDYSNFHITYEGVEGDNHVWKVVDTAGNTTKYYETWAGFEDSDAAYYAAQNMATSVGEQYSAELGSSLLDSLYGDTLVDVFLTLLLL